MPTTDSEYRDAALERMGDAHELKRAARYPLAMYASGVAVECMLRAFRHRDRPHEAHHDPTKHFVLCDAERLGESARARLRGPVAVAHLLWLNHFRYKPERQLRQYLNAIEYHKRVKLTKGSDALKVACIELMDAALEIVTIGDERWRNP